MVYIREITAAIRNDEPDKPGNWQYCIYIKKSIENGDNIFWPGPKKKEKKVVGGAGEVIEQVES